jgi:hypothetical protein
MKKVCIGMLLLFILVLLFGCEKPTDALTFYFRNDYVSGEAIETEPKLEETIRIPIISNLTYDDVTFISVQGENVNDIDCTIVNSSVQFYEFQDYMISNINLKFEKYQFRDSATIESIALRFDKDGIIYDIVFPVDIHFQYDSGILPVSSFATLKRIQAAQPYESLPYFFFVLYPQYSFTLKAIDDGSAAGLLNLRYGIANTTDFNDVNDMTLSTVDPNSNFMLKFLANHNIYLDLGFNIELGKYCEEFHPILLAIELENGETRNMLVMNTNAISAISKNVEDYISAGFGEQ